MNTRLKRFFSDIPSRPMTARELERTVVSRFNQSLEMFPPGYSPADVIEDGMQEHLIRQTNGKYRVIPD
jgi:hypothetical protein